MEDNNDDDGGDAGTTGGEKLVLLESCFAGYGFQRHNFNGGFKMLTLFYASGDYDPNEDEEERLDRVNFQCDAIWKLQQLETFQFHRFPHPNVPTGIGNLRTLKVLNIANATRLEELPPDIGSLVNLVQLTIDSCTELTTLPAEIGDLTSLTELDIKSNPRLHSIPGTIGRLRNLKILRLYECHAMRSLPPELGQELHGLEELFLSCLNGLETLPNEFGSGLTSLKFISLYECENLTNLEGVQWHAMNELACISVTGCTSLRTMPMAMKQAGGIEALNLSGLSRDALLDFFSSPWRGGSSPLNIGMSAESEEPETSNAELELGRDYCRILSGLPNSLERLNVTCHGIDNLKPLLDAGLPRSMRTLILEGNPILDSEQDDDRLDFQNLLQRYPLLGCVSNTMHEKLFNQYLLYLLLLNKCGRILLVDSTKPIPLSMWPTVLRNVTVAIAKERPMHLPDDVVASIRSSIMYAFLQGPALLGRLAAGHQLSLKSCQKRKRSII